MGYNGFPRRMCDDSALYSDRETKYSRVIHAEVNAILTAREPLNGYTLYTWPLSTCDRCSVLVIQSGITRVVSLFNLEPRWDEALKKAASYYKEAGVELCMI
jgi:dCMP deaminase